MPMTTFDDNGTTRTGYLALPPSGTGSGVLVLHAWWGLNDDVIAYADRLAASGFAVAGASSPC